MPKYEYAVVPAPRKGAKAKGAKTPDQRFAHALAVAINAKAQEGWEYLRTDTLPSEERSGLTGKSTVFQNMLIFRRALDLEDPLEDPLEDEIARLEPPAEPAVETPEPEPKPTGIVSPVPPLQVLDGSGNAPPLGPADDDRRPAST